MHTMLVLFLFRGLSASEPPAEADDRATQKAAESTVIEEVFVPGIRFQRNHPEVIEQIWDREAKNHITEITEVCGTIFQVRADLPDSILDGSDLRGVSGVQITHLFFGQPYPDHVFSGLVWGAYRRNFPYKPESLEGQEICLYGKITRYRGKPAMVLFRPEQIATEITQSPEKTH